MEFFNAEMPACHFELVEKSSLNLFLNNKDLFALCECFRKLRSPFHSVSVEMTSYRFSIKNLSTSIPAMAPVPAATMAWR